MALDFGKLNYNVSLNPTSAFPLDARSYFESYTAAAAAASTAAEAGNKDTVYYFGETVAVVENNTAELYIITPSKTLRKLGEGGTGTTYPRFYVGFLLNNEFYKDSTYTEPLTHDNTAIYLDVNGTYRFYKYHGDSVGFKKQDVQDLPTATEEIAGIMKLYQTHGENTDGTMSQKSITEGVQAIKFAAEGDCLVLDLPW